MKDQRSIDEIWEREGVPTPDCPGGEAFCTLCEPGNWELEIELSKEEDDGVRVDQVN